MNVTRTLIDRAAELLGGQNAVAERLGVSGSKLSQWKNGKARIQPDDLAAIAHLAGYNAMNVLAAATIQHAAGTPKEALLEEALGKLSAGSKKPENGASVRLIQCILCKVDQTHVKRVSKKLKALTERKQRSSLTE